MRKLILIALIATMSKSPCYANLSLASADPTPAATEQPKPHAPGRSTCDSREVSGHYAPAKALDAEACTGRYGQELKHHERDQGARRPRWQQIPSEKPDGTLGCIVTAIQFESRRKPTGLPLVATGLL